MRKAAALVLLIIAITVVTSASVLASGCIACPMSASSAR